MHSIEDPSQVFQQGENLAFDLIGVDSYGNHVKQADLSDVSAKFIAGSIEFPLSATEMPGVVRLTAQTEADNR